MKENKIKVYMANHGKCLCQNDEKMKQCKYYLPWNGNYQPTMCTWLDKWTGITCLRQED
jgi:glucan phosphoethanolaminetransferase (alkaline phosphatase superfamily)